MNKYIFTLILIIIIPASALAGVDLAYYAPNGGIEISAGLKRIALVYSDSTYQTIFFIVAILGLIASAFFTFLYKPITTGLSSSNAISFIAPFLIGATIYFAAFVPTGTLAVYDPIKNKTEVVSNIPDAVVILLGLSNLIEKAIVNSTETASAFHYGNSAGGINYQMLIDAVNKGANNKELWLSKDVTNYYNKCGRVMMSLEGAKTNIVDLRTNVDNIFNVLQEWQHPGLWVNIHNNNARVKNMTCTEAWTDVLKPQLENENIFNVMADSVCSKNGFNISDSGQKIACHNLIDQAWSFHGLPLAGAGKYIRESFLANSILTAINAEDPLTAQRLLSRRQLTIQGMGVMNTAVDTLPNLKAVMVTIILGVFPFLTIFLVTPLYASAMRFMVGGVLWLSTWGVMIAVTHTAAMDQAFAVFTEIQNNKMGLKSFMDAETASMRALAIFGRMQSMSLMLASAIAFALYKFGGYAMTQMAEMQAQNLQNIGESAAQQTFTPQGRAQEIQAITSGMAYTGAGASNNFSKNMEQAQAADLNKQLGHGAGVGVTAKENETSVAGQAQDASKTETMVSQAGATAKQDLIEKLGDGDAAAGAQMLANIGRGQEEGGFNFVKNMTDLKGGDSENTQDLYDTANVLRTNENKLPMSGEDILGADMNLTDAQKEHFNDNKEGVFNVGATFDTEGNMTSFDISQKEALTDDASTKTDTSSTDDSSKTTVSGEQRRQLVGANENSVVNALSPQPTNPAEQENWQNDRSYLTDMLKKANTDPTGSEANWLARGIGGYFDSLVNVTNNDATGDSTRAGGGADASFGAGIGKWGFGANVFTSAEFYTRDEDAQVSNVNNAAVRNMIADSKGNLDSFNTSFNQYEGSLLEKGQDALEDADVPKKDNEGDKGTNLSNTRTRGARGYNKK